MPEHLASAAVDLPDAPPDQCLYTAARGLADVFERGLPVPELRPAVRERVAELCACVLDLDAAVLAGGGPLVFESLQAVSLQSVVQACLGRSLPLDLLLDGADVEQITELLLQTGTADHDGPRGGDDGDGVLPAIRPDPAARFEPFPLTEIQQAYLLGREGALELGNVASTFYLELDILDLDVSRLETALHGMVARHGALRTIVSPDGYQQVLADVPAGRIPLEDVSSLDETARAERLRKLRADLTDHSFDPGCWPLFELRATRTDQRRTRLHLAIDLLICDGSSIARLVAELSQRYVDPCRVWPGLEVSFRDYQVALAGVEGSPRFERAREYWLGRVDALPAAPELPLAVPLSEVERPRFSQRSFVLDAAGWEGLRGRASRCGLTASVVLAAAYGWVLGQWSGSSRFTLNVTVNGRLPLHRQVDGVLGDFTALTLLEVDPAGSSFVEFARGLQRRLWADLDHREFGGVRVLRELARRRGATTAAMPVVFTSSLDAGTGLRTGPLGELVETVVHTPQVCLDHQAFQLDQSLVLSWDVVEEVFPPGVVDAMFAAYCGLVRRLAGQDGVWQEPVGPLLPAGQLRVRAGVNDTGAVVPQRLLHRLGGALRQRGPGPAVVAGDRVLSYAELDRRAVRVARRLRQLGVRPNQLVAVVADKGWPQVVAALGVLYSGAAYLPVDASLPVARVRHLLARGQVQVVLTTGAAAAGLPPVPGLTRLVVDEEASWAGVDDSPLEDDPQAPTDLAYVIFTSGSTGQPKGVAIDHRGAANTVADINRRYRIGTGDRVLALSSLSFDLSVWDIFGVLAAGGTIVLPEPAAAKDPAGWAELVTTHRVTVWNTVPALMDMLVTHCETATHTDLGSLRVVLLSGDWIPLGLPTRIRALASPTDLVSLGGATEASIWSIHHPITNVEPGWPSIPYGRPLTNQTCHVLDEHLQPRPDWVPGQLYIGGAGLAQGYWHDPQQTAASFIEHPGTGQRLYRTGDLGRYLPDGTIEFLGRQDNQVKINGYRIELGEIEATLTRHPAVKDTIVTATNNHLTAYTTTESGSAGDPAVVTGQLLDLCRHRLPGWMVPSQIVHLEALPLTPNGKVDRAALARLEPPAARADETVAPCSQPEQILHDIWCDLLGRDSVSVFEDFAAVGGDSLLGLQVIHRAAAHGLVISPRDFFAAPTIADMAACATAGGPAAGDATPGGAHDTTRGSEVSGPVPLLPRQVAFLAQHPQPPAHWHYTLLFEVVQPMDRTALRVALRSVLRHHDGLRVSLRLDGEGRWAAHVAPAADYPLPFSWHDLSDLPEPQQRAALERTCRELARSISLAGPLLHVAYFHTGPAGNDRLYVVGHWLLWDNYSCRIFLEDLLSAHDQVVADGEVSLPDATPLSVWARQLTALATSPEVTGERDHWQRLRQARPAPLPVDHHAANRAGDERMVLGALGVAATARLSRPGTGTTTADLLLAATARALARWAGTDAVRVDLDAHGRNRTDVAADPSRTIGRLSVRRPLDVAAPAGQDLLQAARSVTASRQATTMDGANFDLLAHVAGDDQLRAAHAQVLFNYLGRVDSLVPQDRLRLATEDPGPAHEPAAAREHLLEFLAGSIGGDTLVACTYSAACHDEPTIRALVLAALEDVRAALGAPAPEDTWALPPVARSIARTVTGT
jgi:amino acid adenylation domain-containing protein/non-ribosomal peptide synthase protein (TIGR01720 family)